MGKFVATETAIFAMIEQLRPALQGAKVYPANYLAANPGTLFLKVAVLPNGTGVNLKSTSGVVLVDIYSPAGEGPRMTSLIADGVDAYLVGKTLNTDGGVVQFNNSSLSMGAVDKDSPSLWRSTYSIPFNFYGAT